MKRSLILIAALLAALILPCALAESEIDMLAVDHRLYELGYRDGACNGVLDEITINALKNFQRVNGLQVTGEPDGNTVGLLLSASAIGESEYLTAMSRQYVDMESLAFGSSGDEVARLQRTLRSLGYFSGSSDGVYGEETKNAVCRFQLANGLRESGVADGSVFLRLYGGEAISWQDFLHSSCASVGDSGSAVRTLQIWLRHKGYFNGECTGRYGEGTQQAVKRFQSENGLEVTGDADMDTCRVLYYHVDVLLRDSLALRRGDTDAAAEALCRELAKLGYPVHARFNMQTELALMQFQLANKLPVTGVADDVTLARLNSGEATALADYVQTGKILPEDDQLLTKFYKQATRLLGQKAEFDTDFGFVQYVYLKCGAGLMDNGVMESHSIGAADSIEAGSVLGIVVNGREICGIATSDRAVIYRGDSGYIIMSYIGTMEAESICLYTISEEV